MIKHYESEGTSTNFQQMRLLCCELGLPEGQKRVRTIPGQWVFLCPIWEDPPWLTLLFLWQGGTTNRKHDSNFLMFISYPK